MRRLKGDRWKAGIAIAGMLLLLVLMVWIPVSGAGAYEGASGLATPVTGTVQATPTEDATMTALNKEKLEQEIQQLKYQNAPDFFGWLRTNAAIIISTLVVVIGGLIGLFRWFGDRRDAEDKDLKAQAEERFKTAVAALGDKNEGTQVGGAILLRSFLNKNDEKTYARYYTQIFDLAVAYLRPSRKPSPSEDPDGIPHSPEEPNTPLPLTTLRQALIVVFKEAFPLARSQNKGDPQSLDAAYIQLDNAYLAGADLKQAWMPQASLREANLSRSELSGTYLSEASLSRADLSFANLSRSDLNGADLSGADLSFAHLSGAHLRNADLSGAHLRSAHLSGAHLTHANLSRSDLSGTDLSGADLSRASLSRADLSFANLSRSDLNGADLSGADLRYANLSGADLGGADLGGVDLNGADLSGADLSYANLSGVLNLEDARYLKDANLYGVKGLTQKQVEVCKAKGTIEKPEAICSLGHKNPARSVFCDECGEPLPSTSPPQLPVSPPALAPSAPPAQVNTPTPGTDRGNTASSQQGLES